jgi:hypothetical protein
MEGGCHPPPSPGVSHSLVLQKARAESPEGQTPPPTTIHTYRSDQLSKRWGSPPAQIF